MKNIIELFCILTRHIFKFRACSKCRDEAQRERVEAKITAMYDVIALRGGRW